MSSKNVFIVAQAKKVKKSDKTLTRHELAKGTLVRLPKNSARTNGELFDLAYGTLFLLERKNGQWKAKSTTEPGKTIQGDALFIGSKKKKEQLKITPETVTNIFKVEVSENPNNNRKGYKILDKGDQIFHIRSDDDEEEELTVEYIRSDDDEEEEENNLEVE